MAVWLQAVWWRRTALTIAFGALAFDDLALHWARDHDLVVLELDHVLHLELARVGVDPAGVGDLPAALRVERRLGELDGQRPSPSSPNARTTVKTSRRS